MWSLTAEMMMRDILEAVRQESETRRMGVIEFIINCLKPVYDWLQSIIWGKDEPAHAESFNVSEYLQRREEFILSLEEERYTEYTIMLWWGFDGLRLNKDGSREWISRKKPEPVKRNVFYQPCQTMNTSPQFGACQNIQSTIDTLQMQNAIQSANTLAMMQLESYQVVYPGYYAPYFYGGMYAQPPYLQQMQNCCCSGVIR